MSLPAAVTSHHTAWVSVSGSTSHPARYAVDGNRLVSFGDESLIRVPDNARVSVSIHEIAGGPLLAEFGTSLHLLLPEAVTMNALVELVP